MSRVLVLGASGFIGAAIARRLDAEPGVITVRAHRGTRSLESGPVIDVRDEGTLTPIESADVVVHAAHAVTGSDAVLSETNVAGAANVASACRRSGARLVSIGTASVYGDGPWAGDDIQKLEPAPRSQVSASRARGDEAVLATGGLVVRPHLVHGPLDRWFVPAARSLVGITGWIDGGTSLHSTIHVDDLARIVVDAALRSSRVGVMLASDPARTLPDVLRPYLRDQDIPRWGSTRAEAIDHPAGAGDRPWRHHVDLMALDHHLSDSAGSVVDPLRCSPERAR